MQDQRDQNRDGKMNTDKRIGKLKDRLGWIRETDGLKRLQKKLYTLTKVFSNESPRQSAAKQARSLTIKKVSSDDGWSTSLKY